MMMINLSTRHLSPFQNLTLFLPNYCIVRLEMSVASKEMVKKERKRRRQSLREPSIAPLLSKSRTYQLTHFPSLSQQQQQQHQLWHAHQMTHQSHSLSHSRSSIWNLTTTHFLFLLFDRTLFNHTGIAQNCTPRATAKQQQQQQLKLTVCQLLLQVAKSSCPPPSNQQRLSKQT